MGLAKMALGLAGILLAFMLSVIASGRDVEGAPYTIAVEFNVSKRAFELLNITLDRPYRNVTIKISNIGASKLTMGINDKQLELKAGDVIYVKLDNLFEIISLNFESKLGRAELTVYTTWREGVNPLVSLMAILILVPSMIVAGYGIIEYVVLRRF